MYIKMVWIWFSLRYFRYIQYHCWGALWFFPEQTNIIHMHEVGKEGDK